MKIVFSIFYIISLHFYSTISSYKFIYMSEMKGHRGLSFATFGKVPDTLVQTFYYNCT